LLQLNLETETVFSEINFEALTCYKAFLVYKIVTKAYSWRTEK